MPKTKLAVNLLLDCGVYSAFRKGEALSINDYMAYIREHKELLWNYVTMDVLPFGREKLRTDAAIEEAAAASYRNLQVMKDAGLSPVPVFHMGEKFKWLEKMIKDGEQYIGVSTIKTMWNEPSVQRRWLDNVFSCITDSKGKPLIKAHGLGVTSIPFLLRYPWYTTDSTTWSLTPSYGKIIVPVYHNGKPDYNRQPLLIVISLMGRGKDASPKWRNSNRGYMEGHGPYVLDCMRRFLEEEAGVELAAARYSGDVRRYAALVYFKKFMEARKVTLFRNRMNTKSTFHADGLESIKLPPLRVFFATTAPNSGWGEMMTGLGLSDRLLNYYELRNISSERLEQYVITGAMQRPANRRQSRRIDWRAEPYANFRRLALLERLDGYKDESL